jgi:hypothetical protein
MTKKLHATTSRFKRHYRREVYTAMRELRKNENDHPQLVVNQLVRVTLRQRSGHYMNKGIRKCFEQIPQELRQK